MSFCGSGGPSWLAKSARIDKKIASKRGMEEDSLKKYIFGRFGSHVSATLEAQDGGKSRKNRSKKASEKWWQEGGVLEASWRRLGGVLGRLGGILATDDADRATDRATGMADARGAVEGKYPPAPWAPRRVQDPAA